MDFDIRLPLVVLHILLLHINLDNRNFQIRPRNFYSQDCINFRIEVKPTFITFIG